MRQLPNWVLLLHTPQSYPASHARNYPSCSVAAAGGRVGGWDLLKPLLPSCTTILSDHLYSYFVSTLWVGLESGFLVETCLGGLCIKKQEHLFDRPQIPTNDGLVVLQRHTLYTFHKMQKMRHPSFNSCSQMGLCTTLSMNTCLWGWNWNVLLQAPTIGGLHFLKVCMAYQGARSSATKQLDCKCLTIKGLQRWPTFEKISSSLWRGRNQSDSSWLIENYNS